MKKFDSIFWLASILGSIFSAFALVNLITNAFEIGLGPTFVAILAYYEATIGVVTSRLLNVLQWLCFGWRPPDFLRDLWVLSFVGSATMARTNARQLPLGPIGRFVVSTIVALIFGAIFYGLVIYPLILNAAVLAAINIRNGRSADYGVSGAWWLSVQHVILAWIGVAMFFALNAFSP